MNYNDALKRLRKDYNYNQKQIAEILNTSQQQWSLYENGMRELSTSQIIKLCKKLNVSADYVLGLTDRRTSLPRE